MPQRSWQGTLEACGAARLAAWWIRAHPGIVQLRCPVCGFVQPGSAPGKLVLKFLWIQIRGEGSIKVCAAAEDIRCIYFCILKRSATSQTGQSKLISDYALTTIVHVRVPKAQKDPTALLHLNS